MHPSFNYFAGQSSDNFIKIYETKVFLIYLRQETSDLIEKKDLVDINVLDMLLVFVFHQTDNF